MIRNLYKETKAGVSRSFEKKRGVGKKSSWRKRQMGKEKEEDRKGGGKRTYGMFSTCP